MKKVLTILAVSSLSAAAFAQGLINWTGAAGNLIGQTNGTVYSSFESATGAPTLTGTQGNTTGNAAASNASLGYNGYYYELLTSSTAVAAPTTLAGLSAWSDTALSSTNASTATGKTVQVGGTTTSSAANWPGGNTQAAILVGWSANLGSSWSTVLGELNSWQTAGATFTDNGTNAAYFGVSAFGSAITSTVAPNAGNAVFGVTAGQILNNTANPMQLDELPVAVPEPGTLALAALGGASLLLFRRRK